MGSGVQGCMVRDCHVLPKRNYEDLVSLQVVSVVTLEPSMLAYKGAILHLREAAQRDRLTYQGSTLIKGKPTASLPKKANDSSMCFESGHISNKI